MNRNDARESRRSILAALGAALRTIGNSGLTGSAPMEAFASAHRCLGRLQAIDEMEAYTEACECGRKAQFPRPIIERYSEFDHVLSEDEIKNLAELGRRTAAGLIDPLLTPSQVEAAFNAAREQELAEAAEAFEVAEDSDESLDSVCAALDRAAVAEERAVRDNGLVGIAPGVGARRSNRGSISLSGTVSSIRAYLRELPADVPAAELIEAAYQAAVNGGVR